MTPASRAQVAVIDLLRFTAAVTVLIFHLVAIAPKPLSPIRLFAVSASLPQEGTDYTWFGWVGVEVFFVISGYVIALTGRDVTPMAFARRRVLRLAPTAWICSSLTAAVLILWSTLAPPAILYRWLAALVFIPLTEPIDGVYWTLSVELTFYALAAVALRRGGKGIEAMGVRLGFLSVVFWLAVALSGAPGGAIMRSTAFTVGALPYGAFFSLGVLPYGVFFALGVTLQAMARQRPSWSRVLSTGVLLVAGCGAIGARATLEHGLGPGRLIPVALFALAVAMIACADRLQAPLIRRIGAERLATIGLITYPIYLLHQVIGDAVVAGLMAMGIGAYPAMAAAGTAMLIVAGVVTMRIEPPLRRWLTLRLSSLGRRFRHGLGADTPLTASPRAG